jgi:hypothetical protein
MKRMKAGLILGTVLALFSISAASASATPNWVPPNNTFTATSPQIKFQLFGTSPEINYTLSCEINLSGKVPNPLSSTINIPAPTSSKCNGGAYLSVYDEVSIDATPSTWGLVALSAESASLKELTGTQIKLKYGIKGKTECTGTLTFGKALNFSGAFKAKPLTKESTLTFPAFKEPFTEYHFSSSWVGNKSAPGCHSSTGEGYVMSLSPFTFTNTTGPSTPITITP